jgi:hypothetical protein
MTIAEEEALLAVLSNTPESTSAIYRRLAGLHEKKNLTRRRRRERRTVGVELEQMAQRGLIQCGEGDRYPIPMYSLLK